MPELPEVQTMVNGLRGKILGRRIIGIWFDYPEQVSLLRKNRLIKSPKPSIIWKGLKGKQIVRIDRRGKNILIYLGRAGVHGNTTKRGSTVLLIHPRMTGHFLLGRWQKKDQQWQSLIPGPLEDKTNRYLHFVLYLTGKEMLGLSDVRKFAKIILAPIDSLPLEKLGPEPFSLSFRNFKRIIGSQKRKIKSVLMDQNVIAGIGNIYSDEILWQASINPQRPANSLDTKELKAVFGATKFILRKALRLKGASVSDYRDVSGRRGGYAEERLVYRLTGNRCSRCGNRIERVKIGGRTAHFCPGCQV